MSSAAAAARSLIRSAASRTVRKANIAGGARVSRSTCSPFSIPKRNSLSNPMLRSPVELSCCVETILPYHTANASALLTSMLSVSRRSYGWNPKANKHTDKMENFILCSAMMEDLAYPIQDG